MIPIRDTQRSRRKPVVMPAIILINVVVFLHELSLGDRLQGFVFEYGLTPKTYFSLAGAGPQYFVERFRPILTSMYIHGGVLHIAFNMLFLWIFGDNVEDRTGRVRFLVFYTLCGIGAAYLQLYLNRDSAVPMIGASGAIAGVMGAYMILYPRARVMALIPIFLFIQVVELPAYFFIGFWFLLQFVTGATSLVSRQEGGVAWWAHVGGFAAGAALIWLFAKREVATQEHQSA